MLKGKDIFTFVRFGGLDLKNQNGFSQTPETYHQPPASRGFYAMPKIAQEFFLIGSLSSTQPGIFAKSGDNVINKKAQDPNYYKNKLRQIRKEFKKQGFDISIKSITKKYLGREEFYVNADYDAEDDAYVSNEFFGELHPFDMLLGGHIHAGITGLKPY